MIAGQNRRAACATGHKVPHFNKSENILFGSLTYILQLLYCMTQMQFCWADFRFCRMLRRSKISSIPLAADNHGVTE
jgi:hypothetical protein